MEIFEILNYVPYLAEVLAGLVAAHALALFIVNLTPTPPTTLTSPGLTATSNSPLAS